MTNCRGIWIQEEKELLQEVAGMGELREPWHTKQIELLDRHLHLLHLYSQAKENLAAYKGKYTDASIFICYEVYSVIKQQFCNKLFKICKKKRN